MTSRLYRCHQMKISGLWDQDLIFYVVFLLPACPRPGTWKVRQKKNKTKPKNKKKQSLKSILELCNWL